MRRWWLLYALLCWLIGDDPVAHGFIQQSTSMQRAFASLIGTKASRGIAATHLSPLQCSVSSSPSSTSWSASTSESVEGHNGENEGSLLPFRHSSTVYIEMTDMYGIVYHANYLTYARRAIEDAFGTAPRIHHLRDVKYRAAATAGENVIVEGNLLSFNSRESRSHWRFQISAADSTRVFVSAEVILSWPGGALPPGYSVLANADTALSDQVGDCPVVNAGLLQPLPKEFADPMKSLGVVVWSDDLEGGSSIGGEQLSIRAVLNYFERIRTLGLGRGADDELGLVRLHREGVSIVVTTIADLRVNSEGVSRGDKLEVRMGTKLTRVDRILTVYETLWKDDGTLVAHAEIALMCIANETRKFRPVPSWVQDILAVPSTAPVS